MKVKNLALSERPMKFSDVIGQDLIMENLSSQSRKNIFFQSYLLYGHYGCGKTTTARILAAAVNCRSRDSKGNPCGVCPHCIAVKQGCVDVVEIDGASNTGVDNVRQLKETAEYLPTVLDKKVYIIDEVHKLSDAAFNALLKVLEEPPEHVVFILATTDRDKIPATVLSRLAKYEFRRIPTKTLVPHMEQVAVRNGYAYTMDGLATIARNADGSVRNAIKMLEIVSELDGGATEENASQMIGLADPEIVYGMLDFLMLGDGLKAFYRATDLMDAGWDPRRLTDEMISVCSDAILAEERMDLVDASECYKALLAKFCGEYNTRRVIDVLDFLMSMARSLRETAGDCSVFKNGILLFTNHNANRLELLEQQVYDLQETLQSLRDRNMTEVEKMVGNVASEHEMAASEGICENPIDAAQENWADGKNEKSELDAETTNADIRTENAEDLREFKCNEARIVESELQMTDEPVMKENGEIDPFAIFSGFSFSTSLKTEQEVPFSKTDEKEQPTEKDAEQFLSELEDSEPVLDNLLALGFTKQKDGETTVFETEESAFYRMGKAIAEARNGIPVELRMVQ